MCLGDMMPGGAFTDFTPAGSPPGNGRWGHADLGGEVYEWQLDEASARPPKSG